METPSSTLTTRFTGILESRFTPAPGTEQVETIQYRSRHELYVLALQLADWAGYACEDTRPGVTAVLKKMDETGGLTFKDGARAVNLGRPAAVIPVPRPHRRSRK